MSGTTVVLVHSEKCQKQHRSWQAQPFGEKTESGGERMISERIMTAQPCFLPFVIPSLVPLLAAHFLHPRGTRSLAGCYILRPTAYFIWECIQLRILFKCTGQGAPL